MRFLVEKTANNLLKVGFLPAGCGFLCRTGFATQCHIVATRSLRSLGTKGPGRGDQYPVPPTLGGAFMRDLSFPLDYNDLRCMGLLPRARGRSDFGAAIPVGIGFATPSVTLNLAQ
jgi:hypothetical protein